MHNYVISCFDFNNNAGLLWFNTYSRSPGLTLEPIISILYPKSTKSQTEEYKYSRWHNFTFRRTIKLLASVHFCEHYINNYTLAGIKMREGGSGGKTLLDLSY